MSHVAWSLCVCVCVCSSHGWVVLKRLNRSTCRLKADSCGSKEPCIRSGQDRTNPFAVSRGDKTTMRPFAISLWTLVSSTHASIFITCIRTRQATTRCRRRPCCDVTVQWERQNGELITRGEQDSLARTAHTHTHTDMHTVSSDSSVSVSTAASLPLRPTSRHLGSKASTK